MIDEMNSSLDFSRINIDDDLKKENHNLQEKLNQSLNDIKESNKINDICKSSNLKQIREISAQRSQNERLKTEIIKIKEENERLETNSRLFTESLTDITSLRNTITQLNQKISELNKECRICYKKSDETNILKLDCGCIGNSG